MNTIIELCHALPDSETELRERASEFNEAVRLATDPRTFGRNFLNNIADAKAATDAMSARGYWFRCQLSLPHCDCWLAVLQAKGGGIQYSAYASTEELARSAAAYLAALAMEEAG